MDDHLSCLKSSISLISKLKEPSVYQGGEHSLSKIIREQPIDYDEEFIDGDWKEENQRELSKKMNKIDKKSKNIDGVTVNPENRTVRQYLSQGRK
jgi:hypothetical protein